MLGRKAHIKRKGAFCPLCGSPSIQGGFIEIEPGKAFQKMDCAECEGKWQDVYELIDVRICHEP
jgi:formate dehydrogenase maturation protein FdhE